MMCPISIISKNTHEKCQITNHPYDSHYPYFCIHTYQDLVGVFSADGEGDVIYGELDSPCVGHGLASPVVVLHSHLERHKPGLLRAQSHQLIYTRALEVKPMAIKSPVVRVT